MGIDTRITFKKSNIEINDLCYELGSRVGSNWFDHPIITRCKYGDYWEIRSTQRYWGPGYERGYWPAIYATLEIANLYVVGLKYYGDVSDDDEVGPITPEELMIYHTHFLKGNHTYRSWRNDNVDAVKIPLDMYGHPMVANMWSQTRIGFYSEASGEKKEIAT